MWTALFQNLLCGICGLVFLLAAIIALMIYPEMELFFSTASAVAVFAITVAMLGWGIFGLVTVWRARRESTRSPHLPATAANVAVDALVLPRALV